MAKFMFVYRESRSVDRSDVSPEQM